MSIDNTPPQNITPESVECFSAIGTLCGEPNARLQIIRQNDSYWFTLVTQNSGPGVWLDAGEVSRVVDFLKENPIPKDHNNDSP